MATDMSPTKRRALAPLNANALPIPSPLGKPPSPLKASSLTPKRALDAPASPGAKKLCIERDEVRLPLLLVFAWEAWLICTV